MDGKLLFLALVIGILILAWVGAGVLWRAADMAEIVAPIDPYATRDLEVTARVAAPVASLCWRATMAVPSARVRWTWLSVPK